MSVQITRGPAGVAPQTALQQTEKMRAQEVQKPIAVALPSIDFNAFAPEQRALVQGALTPSAGPASEASTAVAPEVVANFSALAGELSAPKPGLGVAKSFDHGALAQEGVTLGKQVSLTALAARLSSSLPSLPAELRASEAVGQYLRVFERMLGRSSSRQSSPAVRKAAEKAGLGSTANASESAPPDPNKVVAALQSLPPGMDIDAMVEAVMFECGKDTEDDTRSFLKEMQASQKKKQALNALKQQYTAASAKLNQNLQTEFADQQAQGNLGEGVTFDDYKQWRQVTWAAPTQNADGSWTLPEPDTADPHPPALPLSLAMDKPGSEGATAAAAAATAIATRRAAPAAAASNPQLLYGLPAAFEKAAHDYWSGLRSDEKAGGYSEWLGQIAGLKPVSSIDDIAANEKAINDFVTTQSAEDVSQQSGASAAVAAQVKVVTDAGTTLAADLKGAFAAVPSPCDDTSKAAADIVAAYQPRAAALLAQVQQMMGTLSGPPALYISDADRAAMNATIATLKSALGPQTLTQKTLIENPDFVAWKGELESGDPKRVLAAAAKMPGPFPFIVSSEPRSFDGVAGTALGGTLDSLTTAINKNADNPAGTHLLGTTENYQALPDPSAVTRAIAPEDVVTHSQMVTQLKANVAKLLADPASCLTAAQRQALSDFQTANANVTDDAFLGAAQALATDRNFRDSLGTQPLHDALLGASATDRVADHLSNALLGDALVQAPTAEETRLVNAGIIDDPLLITQARTQALATQKLVDKKADVQTAYLANPQRAKAGYEGVGGTDGFAADEEKVTNQIDALSDLNSVQQLKLQTMMENRSKFYETLSNIMKTISSTADGIVSNIKAS